MAVTYFEVLLAAFFKVTKRVPLDIADLNIRCDGMFSSRLSKLGAHVYWGAIFFIFTTVYLKIVDKTRERHDYIVEFHPDETANIIVFH